MNNNEVNIKEINDCNEQQIIVATIFDKNAKAIIKQRISKNDLSNIFEKICVNKDNTLYVDYTYLKYLASPSTYDIITNLTLSAFDNILQSKPTFEVHINMKLLTISDVDKHKDYTKYICNILCTRYVDIISKIYIYNASFIFKQVFNIIKHFIDKQTQDKIVIVKKPLF